MAIWLNLSGWWINAELSLVGPKMNPSIEVAESIHA